MLSSVFAEMCLQVEVESYWIIAVPFQASVLLRRLAGCVVFGGVGLLG